MKILAGDDIYLDNNSLDNNEFVDITIGESISTVEIDDLYVAVEAFRKQKQLRKEYDQSKNHMEESEKKAGRTYEINGLIGAAVSQDTSDGSHTFRELYDIRNVLWMAVAREVKSYHWPVWMSQKHSDGTRYENYFILGIGEEKGKQMTFHLPMTDWNFCKRFADVRETAPEYDGHTSEDVKARIIKYFL